MDIQDKVNVLTRIARDNGYQIQVNKRAPDIVDVGFTENNSLILEYEIHRDDTVIGFPRESWELDDFAIDLELNLLGRRFEEWTPETYVG